jgi:hypothetical protein
MDVFNAALVDSRRRIRPYLLVLASTLGVSASCAALAQGGVSSGDQYDSGQYGYENAILLDQGWSVGRFRAD